MPYLLHAPRSAHVLATPDRSIALFLRANHSWTAKWFEDSEVPNIVSASCIIERPNYTVAIDEARLNGREMESKIKDMLQADGFEDPDVKYLGRIANR